jgi:hypothetical protein
MLKGGMPLCFVCVRTKYITKRGKERKKKIEDNTVRFSDQNMSNLAQITLAGIDKKSQIFSHTRAHQRNNPKISKG